MRKKCNLSLSAQHVSAKICSERGKQSQGSDLRWKAVPLLCPRKVHSKFMDACQAQPYVAILALISAIVDTEYTDRHIGFL